MTSIRPDPASISPSGSDSSADPALRLAIRTGPLDPGLYIVSTPIGNLRDVTLRALDVLSSADLILSEDTRIASKLLTAYDIRTPVRPYHDHNGASVRPGLLNQLDSGDVAIALISDAGTPLVSDPGFKLVRDAIPRGIPIHPVPGASAPLAALAGAGLPTDRFSFAGFLSVRPAAKAAEIETLSGLRDTVILFETGPRLGATLAALHQGLGDRPAVVARELTKLHEDFVRGSLSDLASRYENAPPKGEIVLVIGGAEPDAPPDAETLDAALREALRTSSTREAAKALAARFGLPRKEVYQRALDLMDGS